MLELVHNSCIRPVRGVFIRLMWELEQEYTQRMDKELTSKDEGKNKA